MEELRPHSIRLNDLDLRRGSSRNSSLPRHDSSNSRVTLKHLCAEDKAKIGNLVKALSKEQHERKTLQRQVKKDKKQYKQLKAEHSKLLKRCMDLKEKFLATLKLMETMKTNEKAPSPEQPEKDARASIFFSSDTFRSEVKPRYIEVAEPPVETGEIGTSPMDLSDLNLEGTLQIEQQMQEIQEPPTLLSSRVQPNTCAETQTQTYSDIEVQVEDFSPQGAYLSSRNKMLETGDYPMFSTEREIQPVVKANNLKAEIVELSRSLKHLNNSMYQSVRKSQSGNLLPQMSTKVSPIPKPREPDPQMRQGRGVELFKDSIAGANPLLLESLETRFKTEDTQKLMSAAALKIPKRSERVMNREQSPHIDEEYYDEALISLVDDLEKSLAQDDLENSEMPPMSAYKSPTPYHSGSQQLSSSKSSTPYHSGSQQLSSYKSPTPVRSELSNVIEVWDSYDEGDYTINDSIEHMRKRAQDLKNLI